MRRANRFRRVGQMHLFSPPTPTPHWESLPPDVRRQAVALLIRWLRAVAEGGAGATSREEDNE
jgi:hypothetical protein